MGTNFCINDRKVSQLSKPLETKIGENFIKSQCLLIEETQCVCIGKSILLMQFKVIIAVCHKNRKVHVNKFCEQDAYSL